MAIHLITASLIGTAITMIHTVRVAAGPVVFSIFETIVMVLLPLIVAAFLIWHAKRAERVGWIR